MIRLKRFLFITLLTLSQSFLFAQNERGVLNIRNYSPQEYGAHAQNLCIAQDQRGIMFFGNNRGVLQYDGNYWSLTKVSNNTAVSAIDVDSVGNVFIGASNEFGYLKPTKDGKLEYQSLLEELPPDFADIDKVIGVHCTKEGVYFVARNVLLLWNGKGLKHWKSEEILHTSFFVNDQLYITKKEKGIFIFDGNTFNLIESSRALSKYTVYDISYFRGNLVVTTSDQGIYFLKNSSLTKVTGNIPNIYNATSVYNTYYALGLFGDGLLVLNKEFKKEYLINLRNGLAEGTIHDVFVDRENNLWLALGRGIAKVELITPISVHKYDTGLKGTVQDIIRFKGVLYASTLNGVFYYQEDELGGGKFKQIDSLSIDCFGLTKFSLPNDSMLLVSGVDGIYEIRNFKRRKISDGYPWMALQSHTYNNRLIVGEDGALTSLVRIDNAWREEGSVEGINEIIFNIVEEKNGTLWLGTMNSGIIKTNTKIFSNKNTQIERFNKQHGLPEGPTYITSLSDGQIIFGTSNGIYYFDDKNNRFIPDTKFKINSTHKGKVGVHRISMDAKGQLWVSVFYEDNSYDIMYYRAKDGWYKTPFLRHNNEIVQCFYHEESGITWLGSATGLIRYDQNFVKDYNNPFEVSIRGVYANHQPIFEGTFVDENGKIIDNQPEDQEIILPFSENNIDIEFSALTYYDERGTLFSFKLEGQNSDWSAWSNNPKAVFTNIHEGDYVFKVKAKNIYGVESPVATYRFSISPPWYRTIWAYIGYFIFFVAFVWMAILVSTRSLKRIIEERTAEIVEQKEEIQKQKEIVDEKNKDILDSIKYAKRIQDAILPGEETMRQVLGRDLFVLYKPKDIVSGDFYWMRVKNERVLFSAVDCTGHGVPGAFVSIVGNNGLNRAVNEFGLQQPAAILDNLTKTVEDAFSTANHSDVRDGMDISICSLEMKNYTTAILNWSGANNPLWIIKHDNPTEIVEIKPDKQPIGKYENRKPYTNHEFELTKGDTLYIFTDGYADQFGGSAGKKFKYAQLKQTLIDNFKLDMSAQRELLDAIFEQWKGDQEQVDDVCIIGVRI